MCRRDVFECPPGTWLSALARAVGNLMGSHGGIWAIGPSAGTAPAVRPPLVGLLRGGSSWETIYPFGGRGEDLPALIPERGLLIQHDVDIEQGAANRFWMLFQITADGLGRNFLHLLPLKPSPREPATCRSAPLPQVRAGDRQLPQYLWGRRRPPRYAPSPSFWSTWGRPKQDSCASLRTQPRARRANRAQSTAHH